MTRIAPLVLSLTRAFAAMALFTASCRPQATPVNPRSGRLLLTPTPATIPLAGITQWLFAQQSPTGVITEQDSTASPGQTALAALALHQAGQPIAPVLNNALSAIATDPEATPTDLARLALFQHATDSISPEVVARLRTACTEERCGQTQAEQAQLWLALTLAHETVPNNGLERLSGQQFSSGGWPYQFGGATESTRTTAWTLLALRAMNALPAVQAQAVRFLQTQQERGGTWRNTRTAEPDTGTTALAAVALQGLAPEAQQRALAALRRAQPVGGGAFNYYFDQPGASVEATTWALLALSAWTPLPPPAVTTNIPPATEPSLWWWGMGGLLGLSFALALLYRSRRRSRAWGHT